MTPRDTDVMDRAVRDALLNRMPEARELSFDRIDTRATRRRHRTLARQLAAVAVVAVCAGVAIAVSHTGSKPGSLEVTNRDHTRTPITSGRRHHATATTAPAVQVPETGPTAPSHHGQTPGSAPANVVIPPATNAPASHTTTPPKNPPATSAPPHDGRTPTTVLQPTIPANLPPPYNSIANSRVIVILTDSGYWIDDRTGLHQGAIAHILGSGYFDMLLLDERSATPNSAWLDIAWDQPVTGLIHAWDGAPNGFVKLELVAFPNTVGSAVIRARTSSSKAYNTNVIPGTTATLTLIKD